MEEIDGLTFFEMDYEDALELYYDMVDYTSLNDENGMLFFKPAIFRNAPNTFTHYFGEEPVQGDREMTFEEFLEAFSIVISWESILDYHCVKKDSRKIKKLQREKDSHKDNQDIHPLIRLKE